MLHHKHRKLFCLHRVGHSRLRYFKWVETFPQPSLKYVLCDFARYIRYTLVYNFGTAAISLNPHMAYAVLHTPVPRIFSTIKLKLENSVLHSVLYFLHCIVNCILVQYWPRQIRIKWWHLFIKNEILFNIELFGNLTTLIFAI